MNRLTVRINFGKVSGCKSAGCPNGSGVCIQAINLYYEKLNKSKSTDDMPEETKYEDIWDTSDENIKEASKSLLEILEDNEKKIDFIFQF